MDLVFLIVDLAGTVLLVYLVIFGYYWAHVKIRKCRMRFSNTILFFKLNQSLRKEI